MRLNWSTSALWCGVTGCVETIISYPEPPTGRIERATRPFIHSHGPTRSVCYRPGNDEARPDGVRLQDGPLGVAILADQPEDVDDGWP